ncbi:cupin-like domain-containing protein [Phormidium sp. CCY1219]|uniref:cupin-like domain-containing protein n=1 Tax=Phormidium sp. CCY1219 TaxID=2886104 RepID=UPI002D1E7B5B|nr:cupin-like domain-containing protein [Phormidium sp. CCY1219]MEB3828529.1 cupin-like domain-containing protein [Phormidium sp. CCY1219]
MMPNPQTVSTAKTTDSSPTTAHPAEYRSTLPDEWKKWIAINKMRNLSDGQLVQILVEHGIDIRIAVAEVQAVSANPYFQVARELLAEQAQQLQSHIDYYATHAHKLEIQLGIYRELEKLSPNFGKIERRTKISRGEFFEKYYATNTPVIFTDLMENWKALSLWTPEYLKQKYGSVMVEVQFNRESNPLFEREKEKHKQMMRFADYTDLVVNGGPTNDYYMVPYNGNLHKGELQGLYRDIEIFSEYLDPNQALGQSFFWFGPQGTITPLHHDPGNILLAQVYGCKRLRLISPNQKHLVYNQVGVYSEVDLENPDYEKYPRFKEVDVIDEILHPGEVIFIPIGWWHHVNSLDIAISVSFTNFWFPNHYQVE